MAIFRIAAAIGVLYLVAPEIPRSVLDALPSWRSAAVPTTEQAGAAAIRFCSEHPESCARLLRGALAAQDAPTQASSTRSGQTIAPRDNAGKTSVAKTSTATKSKGPPREILNLRP
jgi:hypothetical protein